MIKLWHQPFKVYSPGLVLKILQRANNVGLSILSIVSSSWNKGAYFLKSSFVIHLPFCLSCRFIYVCKLNSLCRFSPKRVNQFEWNFGGVYSSLSAIVIYMYRLTFLCPVPKYFSHRTYMTLWGNAQLPVQGRNRKSKIAPCSRAWWTLYTLQVSSKSDHVSRRG